jgi:Undecaprenyl-phosphate glucose phosphotransferase
MLLATALVTAPLRILAAAGLRWAFDAGLTGRRAVIAGGGENAALLIRGLAARPDNHIRVCGLFDDRVDTRSPEQVLGVPKLGSFRQVVDFARVAEIDLVIVTLPLDAEARINWLLRQFRVLPVEVRLSAFSRDYAFADGARDGLISVVSRSFSPERRLAKRSFDLAFATLALVVLSPVMLLAAVAVKLDSPGPVFFRQRRHGFNDRVVDVLKFRSMYAENADPEARRIVTRGDPRVTRVGRILRKTSIDELPQLFNVLKGDLSLVGPRPHAVEALSSTQMRFSQMVDGYSARHRLPPGITGWAQINGWRGEIDDPEKLRARFAHDLWYIENWSLWLDLVIILRTPLSLLDTRSAY